MMSDSVDYKYIDPKILRALAEGDNNFIKEMINIFLEDVPLSFQKMTDDLENSNLQSVARQAHKLKPSTGMMGAEIATSLATVIEEVANTNDPNNELSKMLETLKKSLSNCYEDLIVYRSQIEK
jgi:HPt (histidine-containing phosphotransfer) domain-containing protein